MTYVVKARTPDDLRHALIAYAQDMSQREFRQSELARLKKDQAVSLARHRVWRNLETFLKELVIDTGESNDETAQNAR